MNDGGEIVGMVDVLKLTYATLEQINTMASGDSEGPAWNKFWLSLDHESESMVSGDGSHHHTHTNLGSRMMSPDLNRHQRVDSVAPGDSASHVGIESPPRSFLAPVTPDLPPSEMPFPFKFKAPSGRVHRLQVTAAQGIAVFVDNVSSKLGLAEVLSIGGKPEVEDGKIVGTGFAISYLDDEGDSVSITADQDLLEAILLARQGHQDKVDLFVHDPEKPPVPPTPVITLEPASSSVREHRRGGRSTMDTLDTSEDEDDDEEDEPPVHHKRRPHRGGGHGQFGGLGAYGGTEDQVISGVPNDLLLPGAIVSLAVVIVGVFTISRLTR